MPTYDIRDLRDGNVEKKFMSISEMESLDKDRFEVLVGSPLLVSSVNAKPDAGFREVLKRIKRGNPGSSVNDWS
jgi:hypothetical protein